MLWNKYVNLCSQMKENLVCTWQFVGFCTFQCCLKVLLWFVIWKFGLLAHWLESPSFIPTVVRSNLAVFASCRCGFSHARTTPTQTPPQKSSSKVIYGKQTLKINFISIILSFCKEIGWQRPRILRLYRGYANDLTKWCLRFYLLFIFLFISLHDGVPVHLILTYGK